MLRLCKLVLCWISLLKAVLHARHNANLFGKFPYLNGKYRQMDMSDLDIRTVRDWAVFIALRSTGQGKNGKIAWNNFQTKYNTSLSQFCKKCSDTIMCPSTV